jgi:hypothetical protein
MVMGKEAGPVKYAMRQTKDMSWNRRRRKVMMQSLRLMVTSGVVRRAEMDPPQHRADYAGIEADPEASVSSMLPVNLDEQSWFTRFISRRAESLFTHARHTT